MKVAIAVLVAMAVTVAVPHTCAAADDRVGLHPALARLQSSFRGPWRDVGAKVKQGEEHTPDFSLAVRSKTGGYETTLCT